ncbi:MAG: nuclear transport factor 2 family protein [Actinomycetota bacterium]|nr:nuclear transport factor 2 family protein [Actinomycetota bacterium]
MSRPETQLREYFDAGVERVSVDDVVARAGVSEGGLQPLRAKRNLRPAWAAVGAFAATLIGLGGLASVLNLAPRITGDAGAGAAEVMGSGEGMIGIWLVAGFVAAVVAGVTVWLMHRPAQRTENQEEIKSEEGKVTVMETIERTDTEDRTTGKTEQRGRWQIVVIVVLAIALVGLIAWLTLAMRPNSPTAASPEIVQLMEDYNAAWNAYDADALEALVAPQYRIHSQGEVVDGGLEDVRASLLVWMESVDWRVTNEGPYYAVEGDSTGTWLVSSEGSTVSREGKDHASKMTLLQLMAPSALANSSTCTSTMLST